MPTEPASAVPDPGTPTAAETTAPTIDSARPAGVEGGVTAPAAETTLSPNPLPNADDTAAGEADRLLAGVDSVADIQRITGMIPPVGTEPAAPAAPVEEGVPALPADGTLPDRIRTKHLPKAHRDAINALLRNPEGNPDELVRATSAAPAPADLSADAAPVVADVPAVAAPAPAPAIAPLPTVTTAPPARSAESVRAEIEQLGEQQDAAYGRADMDQVAALNKQIRALNLSLPQIERQETQYQREVTRVQSAHQERMATMFPDVVKPGSPLHTEVQRLYDAATATNDPILSRPSWPSLLTRDAAETLGIAPRTPPAPRPPPNEPPAAAPVAKPPTPPLKPAPVSAPTPRAADPAATPPAPAAGGARTNAPSPVAAQAQSEQVLASIKDTNDIMALTRGL